MNVRAVLAARMSAFIIIALQSNKSLKIYAMKNLKRLTRKEQETINGAGSARCTSHGQCFGAWCCSGRCVPYACIEE